MLIIIKGRNNLGRTRSEIETNLHKEWGSATLTGELIDKAKFLEKKTGAKWIDSEHIEKVK
jgi:hypothetical protein